MQSLRPIWFVNAIICLNLGWAQLPATAQDAASQETPRAAAKEPAAPHVYPPELLKQLSEINDNCQSNEANQEMCKCTTNEIQTRYSADEFIALMRQKSAQPTALSGMPQPTGNIIKDGLAVKVWLEQNGLTNSDGTPTNGALDQLTSNSLPAPILAIMQSCKEKEKFAK